MHSTPGIATSGGVPMTADVAVALATWARAHGLEVLVALVDAGRPDLARSFADAAGLDLAELSEQCRAELARRRSK